MVPRVASTRDSQWSSYEDCCETRKLSQFEDDDVDMDDLQDFDNDSESLASSSSFLFSSTSRSTGSTSASGYASDVSCINNAERTSRNLKRKEIQQGPAPTPSHRYGAVDGCIDPRLMASDATLAHHGEELRKGSWTGWTQVSCGKEAARTRRSDTPKPALQDARDHTINDFDILFDEMQVTIPNPDRGVHMWLDTWVARNPYRLPEKVELESLKTLSALSESEIMAWLSQHVSTQPNPKPELIDSGREETPRQTCAPRYRPKCRRSQRRFRHIAEAQYETRIYECTHRCGQPFAKKGQWTRHERYNLEEWRCHLCKFVSARRDKLVKHLREGHSLAGSTKKSHCRQLLQPSARLCGFCLKKFDNWTAWLNHVGAHFEGHIAGGPWTMARWNKAVDQDFGSDESDDDDDDDDDYNNGNDEDQTDHDFDSSAADQAGDPSSKSKGSSYERGSQGSSRSSGSSKSTFSRNGGSRSSQRASGESSYHELGHSTQFGGVGKIDTPSHTVPLSESRSPRVLPLDGGEVQGLLPSKNLELSVQHSEQAYPSEDSLRSQDKYSCEVSRNVKWDECRETITRRDTLERKPLRQRLDAKSFFTVGRVFALLWQESAREGEPVREGYINHTTQGRYGERVFSHIRRMAVVKERQGYCVCIPINTYGGQGVMKSGISLAESRAHSIIHASDIAPYADNQERPFLVKKPIAVKKANKEQRLDKMSRMNFGKRIKDWGIQTSCIFRDPMSDDSKVRECIKQSRVSRKLNQYSEYVSVINCVTPAPPLLAHSGSISRDNLVSENKTNTTEDCQKSRNGFYENNNQERPHFGTRYQWRNDEGPRNAGPKAENDAIFIWKRLEYPTVNQQGGVIDEAHSKTFEWMTDASGTKGNSAHWFTDSLSWKDWLSMNDRGLLWINGSLGLGKSTSMKHVLNDYGVDTTTKYPLGLPQLPNRAFVSGLGTLDSPDKGIGAARLKFRTVELPPRTASFDTIRRLYGTQDQAHLVRFKIERFLKEPDEHWPWEGYLESGALEENPEENPGMLVDLDAEGSMQYNRPRSDEQSHKMAGLASKPGIPCASRRGRNKSHEEDPGRWPI
jgi:hypothetical protein